jgi:hypothetical protein
MKRIYTIILLFVLVFSQINAQSDPTTGLKEIPLTGLGTKDGHTFHFYSSTGKLNIGFSEVFIALTDQNKSFVDNFTVSDFLPLITESTTHSTPVGKVEKVTGKALYKTWFSFLASGTWSLGFNYTIGSSATKSAVISAKTISAKTKSSIVSANDTITQIGFFKDRHCVANSGSLTLPLISSCGIGCGTGSGGMAGCWNSGLGVYVYDPTATGTLTRDSARSATHYLLFDAESKELTRAFLESLPSAANGKISVKVKGYWTSKGIASNKIETVVPELISDSIDHYLKSFHLYSIEGVYIKDGVAKSYSYFDTVSYKLTPTDLVPKNITALHYTGGTRINFTAPANASSATTTLKGYKVRVYDATGNIVDKYTTTVTDTKATSVNVADFIAGSNYTFTVTALYTGTGVEAESQASSGIITQTGFFKDRDCVSGYTLPLTRSCGIACATATSGMMAGCFKSGLGLFIYDASQSGTVITKDVAKSDAYYLLFDAQSKELTRAFIESLPSAASGKISIKVTGYWSADSIASNKNETLVPELIADSIDHKLRAFHLLSIEGVYINGLTYSYANFATTSYKLTPADLAPSNISVSNYTGGAKVKFTAPANVTSASTTLTGYKVSVYNKAGVLQDAYTTTVNDRTMTSINITGFTATQNYTFTVSALYPGSGVVVESDPSNAVKDSIGGITLTVNDYPVLSDINVSDYKVKLVDSFTYNSSTYYLTVAYPSSFVSGSQTVKAYINKKDNDLQSYKVVDGGFYIEEVPYMRSMGMGTDPGCTDFIWNSTDSVYEATIVFDMPGDWRLSLKAYDNSTKALIAGTDLDQYGDGSTLYWDVYLDSPDNGTVYTGIKNTKSTGISVYPTLSQGEITIISPAEATVKVFDYTGKTIETYQSSGSRTISLNVPSGLYLVKVESAGETSVQKVIIRK